jgi:hypothetical protein
MTANEASNTVADTTDLAGFQSRGMRNTLRRRRRVMAGTNQETVGNRSITHAAHEIIVRRYPQLELTEGSR